MTLGTTSKVGKPVGAWVGADVFCTWVGAGAEEGEEGEGAGMVAACVGVAEGVKV
jgi:hypothetical protein